MRHFPDSKVHGAKTGPTWVLSAPDGPHGGPINLAIRVGAQGRHNYDYLRTVAAPSLNPSANISK